MSAQGKFPDILEDKSNPNLPISDIEETPYSSDVVPPLAHRAIAADKLARKLSAR